MIGEDQRKLLLQLVPGPPTKWLEYKEWSLQERILLHNQLRIEFVTEQLCKYGKNSIISEGA